MLTRNGWRAHKLSQFVDSVSARRQLKLEHGGARDLKVSPQRLGFDARRNQVNKALHLDGRGAGVQLHVPSRHFRGYCARSC